MAPKEGNSIVKHGVLDERLNVHGVKNLKVADLSICPDNVGCNTCTSFLLSYLPLVSLAKQNANRTFRLNRSSHRREMRCSYCRRFGLLWEGSGYEGLFSISFIILCFLHVTRKRMVFDTDVTKIGP